MPTPSLQVCGSICCGSRKSVRSDSKTWLIDCKRPVRLELVAKRR